MGFAFFYIDHLGINFQQLILTVTLLETFKCVYTLLNNTVSTFPKLCLIYHLPKLICFFFTAMEYLTIISLLLIKKLSQWDGFMAKYY